MAVAIEIQPPNLPPPQPIGYIDIFLSGSIEMGAAEDWQRTVINRFKHEKIRFLNPRRNDWDPTKDPSKPEDEKYITDQILWELRAMESADYVVCYYDPATKSPVTLFETGLHMKEKIPFVCCSPDYWRYLNIKISCKFYKVNLVHTLNELIDNIDRLID